MKKSLQQIGENIGRLSKKLDELSHTVPVKVLPAGVALLPPIRFYDKNEPYYEFTNFYKSNVRVQVGNDAPIASLLSEGLFQYFKFYGTPAALQVKTNFDTLAPFQAYSSLKAYSSSIIPSWHQVKLYVMYRVVKSKFEQNPTLLEQLKATQSAELIEHILGTRVDCEWGDSVNTTTGLPGKNWLGKILMLVRKELCGVAYPTALAPGTSGTMQEFEQTLAAHKQQWLELYHHEIKGVAGAEAPLPAPRTGIHATGGMTKDQTPIFLIEGKQVAWAPKSPTGACFRSYDGSSSTWGSYFAHSGDTGKKTRDGTPIWRDAAGTTFAYSPAKKRFHRWSMSGDQNSSSCWGSAY